MKKKEYSTLYTCPICGGKVLKGKVFCSEPCRLNHARAHFKILGSQRRYV